MTDPKRISPREAWELLQNEGYTYIDVRSEAEYAAGHPQGSVNIPWMFLERGAMRPNPDFVRVVRNAFAPGAKIVVGCKAGGRSLQAARTLIAEGFQEVVDQRAGTDGCRSPFGQMLEPGWSAEGLAWEEGEGAGGYHAMKREREREPG